MLEDLPVNFPRWIATAMRPRSVGLSLEARQSSNSSCPSGNYKASTNMTFSTHCNSLPIPSSNSIGNPSANSLEDCLNKCSMNPDVLCAGALYEVNSTTCYFFDNGTSFSNSQSNQNYQWGTAIDQDVLPIPQTCNGPSGLQSQSASNGMTFQIFCNTDNGGHDLCPDGDPSCRWHADSLEECLNHCSVNHPLCAGVAWNWGMSKGWLNCYPKGLGIPTTGVFLSGMDWAPAAIQNITDTCKDNAQYITPSKTAFDLTCNTISTGNSFSIKHQDNLDSCLNSCANSKGSGGKSNCVGASFDTYMTQGYENCYLKNATGAPGLSSSGFTYAKVGKARTTTSSSSNSTSTPASSSGGSSSKAWIAGPVIGGVVALAIVGLLIWFWRRRKRRQPVAEADSREVRSAGEKRHSWIPIYHKRQPSKQQPPLPPQEMYAGPQTDYYESGGTPRSELPGSQGHTPMQSPRMYNYSPHSGHYTQPPS